MALLQDKIALVTGGTRGIGKGIVERFLAEGADVAFTFVSSPERANALATELATRTNRKVMAIQSDAGDFNAAQATVDKVVAEWGRLDILVNNAGITKDQLLMRMSEADFDAVMTTNMKSVFNMSKAVLRTMLKQRSGSIIHMSSVVGVQGNAGQANYAASKAAIIGFSKSVAKELGSRNIRSNAIAPGFIETEMTAALDPKVVEGWREAIPLKRGGTPTDVANACVFLGSDLSAYITGQTLSVCGGMLS
ncbi:MAG: 3-oxoacyl-[acyl-carrier-protein] reductase [Flavobacteriales bacterium]|jgi:3-oxoacyl-[acyl-carrier protein] reductase|nr:3-oxoacyl-[acyl-carrier-protein] reductase [Flavobacteriales bacterium]